MKYGVKIVLCTPVKTALFVALILLTTLFLSLGIGVWYSAETMLQEVDETFSTVGEFVYQGGYYPDSLVFDPYLQADAGEFQVSSLRGLPGVMLAEDNYTHRAYVEDYAVAVTAMPYPDYEVVMLEMRGPAEGKAYYGSNVLEIIYSARGQGGSLHIYPPESFEAEYAFRHQYIMAGMSKSVNREVVRGFMPLSMAQVVTEAGGPDGSGYPLMLDVTDAAPEELAAFWRSDAGVYYRNVARMFEVINNSVNLVATGRIEAVPEFHRGEYVLIVGRMFDAADYESGDVCIISSELAKARNLSVGDPLTVHIHRATHGTGVYTSYWPETGFAASETYTVAGIYETSDFAAPIYLPNANQRWLERSDNGYTLGRVVLKNADAERFQAAAGDLLPPGVTLTVHDQGYAAAAASILNMRQTALLITLLSGISGLIVLFFLGYMFIYRNRLTVGILLNLGAGAPRVRGFLLAGSMSVTAVGAALGALVGRLFSGGLTGWIYRYAGYVYDARFSRSAVGLAEHGLAEPETHGWTYAAVAVAVCLVTLLICLLFALAAVRSFDPHRRHRAQDRRTRRKGTAPSAPASTVAASWIGLLPGTSLKYTARAILRGGYRCLVVLLTFGALLAFVLLQDGVRQGYQAQLDAVYDEIPVTMTVVNSRGQTAHTIVEEEIVSLLRSSGFVSDIWYTKDTNLFYHYNGVVVDANGRASKRPIERVTLPDTSAIEDKFAVQVVTSQLKYLYEPLVVTNNMLAVPQYRAMGASEITFAKGYDMKRYALEYAVLVPERFLERNGLKVGAKVDIGLISSNPSAGLSGVTNDTYVIAGSFAGQSTQEIIYMATKAINLYFFNSIECVVADTRQLGQFKDWLAEHFAEAYHAGGSIRRWAVVDDTLLHQTISTLKRYITYMDIVGPVLLLISACIGFLVSNLLLRARRREIALLRSMGTKPRGVFLSLFLEQAIVGIPGVALGLLGVWPVMRGAATVNGWLILILAGCYLAGAALAILQIQRTTVTENLIETE